MLKYFVLLIFIEVIQARFIMRRPMVTIMSGFAKQGGSKNMKTNKLK